MTSQHHVRHESSCNHVPKSCQSVFESDVVFDGDDVTDAISTSISDGVIGTRLHEVCIPDHPRGHWSEFVDRLRPARLPPGTMPRHPRQLGKSSSMVGRWVSWRAVGGARKVRDRSRPAGKGDAEAERPVWLGRDPAGRCRSVQVELQVGSGLQVGTWRPAGYDRTWNGCSVPGGIDLGTGRAGRPQHAAAHVPSHVICSV